MEKNKYSDWTIVPVEMHGARLPSTKLHPAMYGKELTIAYMDWRHQIHFTTGVIDEEGRFKSPHNGYMHDGSQFYAYREGITSGEELKALRAETGSFPKHPLLQKNIDICEANNSKIIDVVPVLMKAVREMPLTDKDWIVEEDDVLWTEDGEREAIVPILKILWDLLTEIGLSPFSVCKSLLTALQRVYRKDTDRELFPLEFDLFSTMIDIDQVHQDYRLEIQNLMVPPVQEVSQEVVDRVGYRKMTIEEMKTWLAKNHQETSTGDHMFAHIFYEDKNASMMWSHSKHDTVTMLNLLLPDEVTLGAAMCSHGYDPEKVWLSPEGEPVDAMDNVPAIPGIKEEKPTIH